jgi:hypothetical protein
MAIPAMNGPNVLDAECPSANQPKLAKRCEGDTFSTKWPTVCCAATESMLKPKPIVTAVTNKVGTVSKKTGNHAPITTKLTPIRMTRDAPTRSTQRPTASAVNIATIENSAMNTPTTYSAEPVFSAYTEPATRPPESAMCAVRLIKMSGRRKGGKWGRRTT